MNYSIFYYKLGVVSKVGQGCTAQLCVQDDIFYSQGGSLSGFTTVLACRKEVWFQATENDVWKILGQTEFH